MPKNDLFASAIGVIAAVFMIFTTSLAFIWSLLILIGRIPRTPPSERHSSFHPRASRDPPSGEGHQQQQEVTEVVHKSANPLQKLVDMFPVYTVPLTNRITLFSFLSIFLYAWTFFLMTYVLINNASNSQPFCNSVGPWMTVMIQAAYFCLLQLLIERALLVDNFSIDMEDNIRNKKLLRGIRIFSYLFSIQMIVNVFFVQGKIIVSSNGNSVLCIGSFPLQTMIPFMVSDMVISFAMFIAFWRPLMKLLNFRKDMKAGGAGADNTKSLMNVAKRNLFSFVCILIGTSGTAGTSIIFNLSNLMEVMMIGYIWVSCCGMVLAAGLLAITLNSWKAGSVCGRQVESGARTRPKSSNGAPHSHQVIAKPVQIEAPEVKQALEVRQSVEVAVVGSV